MPLPLEIDSAADVLIGPIISTSTNLKTDALVYNSAGMAIATYTGGTRTTRTLSGTTNADWWFRSAGGEGMYLLRIPASVLTSASEGMSFAVRGVATGVYDFGNYQALQIVDPEAADILAAIALLSNSAVGLKVQVVAIDDEPAHDISDKVAEIKENITGTTLTRKRGDGTTIVTRTVTLDERDPIVDIS